MKTLQHVLLICLLLVAGCRLLAQQGNVAAGGDAYGTGGSMSYSIGQTDYLYVGSENGSLGFGLQQTWLAGFEPLPLLEISDMQIGDAQCFNASQTVIVAGDGNEFTVLNGGYAEIIAGHNIILKFGTKVEHGGSLYAHISTTWCEPLQSMLSAINKEPVPDQPFIETTTKNPLFKIYPNPTTGHFTLEITDAETSGSMSVQIFGMRGEIIQQAILSGSHKYSFDLSAMPAGIYFVRVVIGGKVEFSKVVKN
jgi:hypothetical protein